MLTKFISALLAVVIAISTFTTMTVSATENSSENIVNDDLNVQGENSFGNMLSNELEGAMAQETTSADFALTGLKIEGQTATVEYMSAIDCTILVALYDEATNKMVASGKSLVSSEEDVVKITIEAEEMPKYFVATAYMLDSNNAPLTDEFTTELYTEEIQKVKAMKATDFDEDRVLKLEDTDETNFAVYSDDTKVLEYKENYNIPVTIDDENGIYVFSNCNDELKTLVKGDMLSYEYSLDNIIILKVDTIKIDGDTVTITEGDAELEEVFDYVKIEGSQDTSNCDVNMDGIDDSVQLVDDSSSVSSKTPSPVGAVEGDVTFEPNDDLKLQLMGDTDGKNIAVTGDIGFGAEATLEFYISLKKMHVDFEFEYGFDYTIALTVKTKDTLEIPIINISIIPVTGVVITFTPTVVFEAEASISLSMSVGGSFGFEANKKGVEAFNNSPETSAELKAEGEMFIGLMIQPQLSIVSKKIFVVGLPVTGGICVEAGSRDADEHEDEDKGIEHLCKVCFEGNIGAKASIEAEVKLFKKEIGKVTLTLKKNLFSFYYSVDYNDVGKGDCPHNSKETDTTEPTESTEPTDATTPTEEVTTEPTEPETEPETEPYIIDSGVCGRSMTWEFWSNGVLNINGSGSMDFDLAEATSWTAHNGTDYSAFINEINISEGVTSFYPSAFANIPNIDTVKIPDSLTYLGLGAFMGSGIRSIEIPHGITYITTSAFSNCRRLSSVIIPNTVCKIDNSAFKSCTSLTSVTIPESVTQIEWAVFGDCTSLTDAYIYGRPDFTPCDYYRPWLASFPTHTKLHYMNNSVSASLATSGLMGTSTENVAEFDGLIAGGDYIVAVVKSEEAEDLLSADNLLYIDQLTADENGNVSLDYVPRESVDNSVALIFGADRMSVSDAEVTAIKDEGSQVVEYTVTLNGAVLTEKVDYELAVDGDSVTVTGINSYKYSTTQTVEPMLIGDVNLDNEININDTTVIMKYLVELESFDDSQKLVADTNGDGVISVTDATQVQKYLAQMITSFK